jgi:outer membrane protein
MLKATSEKTKSSHYIRSIMRKLPVFIVSLLLSVFVLYSCSEEKSQEHDQKQEQTQVQEQEQVKIGYMNTSEVFHRFDMKKDLENRLEEDIAELTQLLDSLSKQIQEAMESDNSALAYQLKSKYSAVQKGHEQQLKEGSALHALAVKQKINEYVGQFAEENGYDVILGATDDGNVMYARKEMDITDDLIKFINAEFKEN